MAGRVFFLVSCLLLSLLAPYSPLAGNAQGEDVKICCDAVQTDLYLIGNSNLELTPFTDLFSESSSSASFETSIASSEPIGKWELESAWPGIVPESTWTVEMDYTVTDAGGANLNLSATLVVGSSSFTGFLGAEQSFVAQGSGTISIEIPVEELRLTLDQKFLFRLMLEPLFLAFQMLEHRSNFFGAVKKIHPYSLVNCPLLT